MEASTEYKQRSEIRWTIVSATLVFACLAITLPLRDSVPQWLVWVSLSAMALAVLKAILGVLGSLGVDHRPPPTLGADSEAPRGDGLALDRRASIVFLEGVAFPSHLMRRVTESVTPLSRAYLIATRYELRLPGIPRSQSGADAMVLVPLMLSRKGILRDNLRASIAGAPVPLATFEETVGAFEVACEAVLRTQKRWWRMRSHAFSPQDYLVLSVSLANARNGDGTNVSELQDQRDDAASSLSKYLDKASLPPAERLLLSIATTRLANHYATCVIVGAKEHETHVIVEVEQRFIPRHSNFGPGDPSERKRDRALTRAVRFLHAIYGLRSGRIEFLLERAFDTHSYHLEAMGAPGTYLARQDLYGEDDVRGYFRFRSRRGQRYGHFYSRRLHRDEKRPVPRILFRFRERTPGYYAPATVVAVVAAALILISWPVAFSEQPGADVVAVLLAAPGAIIGWSGVDQRENHVGLSVAPRVISSLAALTCLAATTQFLLQRNGPLLEPTTLDLMGGQLLVDATFAWRSLAAIGLTIAVSAAYAWARAAVKHHHASTRE